jgi:hypothetical protein
LNTSEVFELEHEPRFASLLLSTVNRQLTSDTPSIGAWFEPRYIFRAGRLDQ